MVLGLISTLLSLALVPAVIDDVLAHTALPPEPSAEQVRWGLQVFATLMAFIQLGAFAVMLALAFVLRAGRGWARVALMIVGGLYVWFTLGFYGNVGQTAHLGTLGVVSGAATILQLVVIAAAIVFQFRPAVGEHLRRASA